MTDSFDRLSTALADRYRIERELGAGGMATVYLAADLKHDRKVAIKVLKPELAAVLGAERFVVEIKTTAALSHPHILPLFDSGEAGGFLYYVMPYIQGETIREKLNRETQFGVDEAVRIATAVADALDYAHRQGVIHRDIKPENILLYDGRPMVMDFGIALAVSAAAGGRMTETGLSLGTPHYMSPEQATAEKEITARSDVYSLASVLYEMLAGQPPHEGGSAQQTIMRIITDVPRSVTELRKSVPSNVAAALMKALEKLPADRFATVKEFSDALANVHFTGSAALGASRARVAETSRVLRGALVGAVALLVVLIAWIVTRPAPELAVFRYGLALPLDQAPDPQGFVVVTSDGSRIIYVGPPGPGAIGNQLWMKARNALTAVPVPGTSTPAAASISPDDKFIAFVQGDFLRRIPIDGGAQTLIARGVANVPGSVAWLDDGAILYVSRTGRAISRVPEGGGDATEVWASDTLTAFGLTALPGGRGALFIGCPAPCADLHLYAVDGRGGEARLVATNTRFGQYLANGQLLMVHSSDESAVVADFDLRTLSLRGQSVAAFDSVAAVGTHSYLAVSRSGTLVTRRAEGLRRQLQLVMLDRRGVMTRVDSTFTFQLTRFAGSYGWELSPDGRRLAIGLNTASGDDIWIKSLPRGPPSRLTFGTPAENRPRWTPDGRHVTFVSDGGVYQRRADGTTGDSLLLAGPVNEAAVSPNGEWLVFRSGARGAVAGGRDIYARRLVGDTTVVSLIVTPFDESSFVFSPDGRWIAYVSDETGREEVFVRPFPNTADAKFQVTAGGGIAPRWSRDGRELYFVGRGDQLMVATIRFQPTLLIGEPQALFTLPSTMVPLVRSWYTPYDVTPDGRFLMVNALDSDNARFEMSLMVVENWLAELTRGRSR